MKKIFLLILFLLLFTSKLLAQTSDKLVVLHNVNTVDMNALSSPLKGSLIFNTDDNEVYEYDGTTWNRISSDGSETKIVAGTSVGVTGTGTTVDPYIISLLNESENVLQQIGEEADAGDSVNSIVTVAQLLIISPTVNGVLLANETAYQDYIDANPGNFSEPATQAEVQNMIYNVNTSSGTLLKTGGNCTVTISGTYDTFDTLTSSEQVYVQVNVTALGTYSITTNTVNGYSFSASGSFTSTGLKTVILNNNNGTPSSGGTDTFTVTYDGDMCNVDIEVSEASFSLPQDELWTSASGFVGEIVNGHTIDIPYTSAIGTYNAWTSSVYTIVDNTGGNRTITLSNTAGAFATNGNITYTITITDGGGNITVPIQVTGTEATMTTIAILVNGHSQGNLLLKAEGTHDGSSSALASMSCKKLLYNYPGKASGTYWIDPDEAGSEIPFQVYCDMTTDGGGWTRIQTAARYDMDKTAMMAIQHVTLAKMSTEVAFGHMVTGTTDAPLNTYTNSAKLTIPNPSIITLAGNDGACTSVSVSYFRYQGIDDNSVVSAYIKKKGLGFYWSIYEYYGFTSTSSCSNYSSNKSNLVNTNHGSADGYSISAGGSYYRTGNFTVWLR